MYEKRLENFVQECGISDFLKENASVLARGSGISAVRARASGAAGSEEEPTLDADNYMAQLRKYEELKSRNSDQMYQHFIGI